MTNGVPLSDMIARKRIADRRVPTNLALPLADSSHTVRAAIEAVAQGYRCLKLKVGNDAKGPTRVADVRRAVGPDVALRLDANGSWGDDAERLLRAVAPLGIEYVEQPLPAGHETKMSALRRSAGVPIAADESAHDTEKALDLIAGGAFDVVIVKPMVLGGLDRAAQVLHAAREKRVRVVVTDVVESAVGRTGALHLAALLPEPRPACGLASGEWFARDVVPHPPRVVEGALDVPTVPGLGIESIDVAEAR